MSRPSPSVEEYLENIFRLQERSSIARTKELAQSMLVTLGTVTSTVEMLERQGYVTHTPYRGVRLTDKGRKTALSVIRRHRLAERLLTDILHLDWSEAHEPACRLEHGLGEDVMKPLGKALGNPKTCPHGNPIPTEHGGVFREDLRPLIDLKIKESGTITKIVEENRELLRHLQSVGLMPGTTITLERKIPFDGSVVVQVKNERRSLSKRIASVIWVRRN